MTEKNGEQREASKPPRREMTPQERRMRRFLVAALVALVLSLAALGASLFVKSPAQRAAEQSPPPPSRLTAPVVQQVLQQTIVIRGTGAAQHSVVVGATSSQDSAVVTALPKPAMSTVAAGDIVAVVSGRPVIALPGTVPAHRDLVPGVRGDDVAALQAALVGLELLDPAAATGGFDADTASAVERLYGDRGFTPLRTGDRDPGEAAQLEAARNSVRLAERRLRDLDAEIATTPQPTAKQRRDRADALEDLQIARDDLAALTARTGVVVPSGEIVFVPALPGTVTKVTASVGSDLRRATSGDILTIEAGAVVVQASSRLGAGDGLAAGQPVELLDERTSRAAAGRIASVAPVPTGDSQQESYPVLIDPDEPLPPDWLGRPVRATVVLASTDAEVLTVPLAAVRTDAGGTSRVVVVRGGQTQEVPVTVGLIGQGQVQVSGDIEAGELVVVSP